MSKTITVIVAILVVSLVGVGIVKIHKNEKLSSPNVQVLSPSLTSLDARVTAIEHRLDVAKAHRLRQAQSAK